MLFFLFLASYFAADIFKAVECGIDVFDTAYALKATENGCALAYPNKLAIKLDEAVDSEDNKDIEINHIFEINLKSAKYCESMDPLLAGCTCYTCTNYSCAYIYHLLDTDEILGGILLMM